MKHLIYTLALASSFILSGRVHAQGTQTIVPPVVPQDIAVDPNDFVPFLVGHAAGTQDYICVAVGSTYAWTPFGPQATLFDDNDQQILTHFLSPTPYSLLPNPTWQHSRDSSVVWAEKIGSSSDSAYVRDGAIPWLLLEAVVVGDGPTGGDKLVQVRRIQRVNTVDGVPPTTGCSQPADIAKRALVPYYADYYFYKEKPTGRYRE